MTTEQLVGVLGLLATVVFGALSVYLVLARRYPGQITLVRESTIALFDSIVKNFSDLSVLYCEQPVSEGLVLFRGAFVNTGSKDITPDMVRERVSLRLPEDFTWRSAKVVSASNAVVSRVDIASHELTFDLGLFRCREFIRFEAVVEVPVGRTGRSAPGISLEKQLHKAILAHHRIADTQKVRVRDFPDEAQASRQLRRLRVPAAMFAVIALVQVGVYFFESPAQLRFMIQDKGTPIEVKATPKPGDTLKITGVSNKDYKTRTPVKDFFAIPGLVAKTVPDRSVLTMLLVMVGITFGLLGVILLMIYSELWQAKRLRKSLMLPDGRSEKSHRDRDAPCGAPLPHH